MKTHRRKGTIFAFRTGVQLGVMAYHGALQRVREEGGRTGLEKEKIGEGAMGLDLFGRCSRVV